MGKVSAAMRKDEAGPVVRLAAVGRETLQDRVYAELRRALIGGLFEPGEVLTIQGLAASLSTSTMPVREALGRLVSERALEALPNRSVRIPLMTPDRLADLLRARLLLEGEAIALAAPLISPEDLETLRRCIETWEQVRSGALKAEIGRELDLNQSFHFRIYRAAGSAVILPMIESLWLQSGPCTRAGAAVFAADGETDTALFHHRMVEALEARDAEAARAALRADISRPFDFLAGNRAGRRPQPNGRR